MIKKLKGITLLEAMLALAIATAIILLGLKNYFQYKRDRDAFALKYNVDMLFQAMRNYYYANCAERSPQAPILAPPSPPALAPSSSPSNPFLINMASLGSYLDASWNPANSLIDSSFGSSGYALQFNNQVISGARTENFCYYFQSMGAQPSCYNGVNPTSQIYLWVAQIVVQVSDTEMTLAFKGLADADCALATYTAASIVDCSAQGVTSGSPAYLVWQRLPSFASPDMSSGLWGGTPTVKQFNLQYTNDSLGELVSATYAGSQYYLCGG